MAIQYGDKEVSNAHIVKTSKQWAASTSSQSILPNGTMCVEIVTSDIVKLKIADGCRSFNKLPYIDSGNIDISNYYTKTEIDNKLKDIDEVSNLVLKFKGMIKSTEQLPTARNTLGDIYFIDDLDSTHQTDNKVHALRMAVWTVDNKTGIYYWAILDTKGFSSMDDYLTYDDLNEDHFVVSEDGIISISNELLESFHTHDNKEELDKIEDGDHDTFIEIKEHAVLDYDKLILLCDDCENEDDTLSIHI